MMCTIIGDPRIRAEDGRASGQRLRAADDNLDDLIRTNWLSHRGKREQKVAERGKEIDGQVSWEPRRFAARKRERQRESFDPGNVLPKANYRKVEDVRCLKFLSWV